MEKDLNKPTILILGTFHMRPSSDMIQGTIDDLLSSKRQEEIREVVERIKQFKPTKLAVEVVTKEHEALNKDYTNYLNGELELKVDEVHQLGFRIPSELNHEEIYAIDWMESGAGTKSVGEVYEWAKENQPDLFKAIFGQLENEMNREDHSVEPTILDLYRNCNNTEAIKTTHQMYINMARIGQLDNYVGMEWLIWWYQRNLILFSNIARISTSPEDRVLLLIGSSHVQILYQFLEESGLFELESAMNYLVV